MQNIIAIVFLLFLTASAALPGPTSRHTERSAVPPVRQTDQHKNGCSYAPGAAYSADIKITIQDGGASVDSASVHLAGRIPSDGRSDTAPTQYVAALPITPVALEHNTLKHFNLAPRIVIEKANTPQCQLHVLATVGQRSTAMAAKSHFSIETTVTAGGRSETTRSTVFVSCFDQDSLVRLASGKLVSVKVIIPGDRVWNPVLHRSDRVREVIQGSETGETMYRIGYGSVSVAFTAQHPLRMRGGVRTARNIALGDKVLGDDGRYHVVTHRTQKKGDPSHLVYNLRLDTDEQEMDAHMLSVGGIVAGDFELQQSLQSGRLATR